MKAAGHCEEESILENELQCELQVAHISTRAGDPAEVAVATVSAVICNRRVRVSPVRMIRRIKCFEPELEVGGFREIEVLQQ